MGEQKYDYKAVGERIRHRRVELNLTQAELAEKISRVPKYCADIERGYCGMSIETLLAFCKALEVSPTTLLLGEPVVDFDTTDVTAQIITALPECTDEQKQSILQTIRLFTKLRR